MRVSSCLYEFYLIRLDMSLSPITVMVNWGYAVGHLDVDLRVMTSALPLTHYIMRHETCCFVIILYYPYGYEVVCYDETFKQSNWLSPGTRFIPARYNSLAYYRLFRLF